MELARFYSTLSENGIVTFDNARRPSLEEIQEFKRTLDELDAAARLELAFEPPPLSVSAAAWAGVTLYRACQFYAYRDIGADVVLETLSSVCPEPGSSAVAYSVDLTMQFLPDLVALSRGLAPEDPLVTSLIALARAWPLSSVGIRDLKDIDQTALETTVLTDVSLKQLYVDRIIERDDLSRLDTPVVRRAVDDALGLHTRLAPSIESELNIETRTT